MADTNSSGLTASELFSPGDGITYNDFNIMDTVLTEIDVDDISLRTDLGRGVVLHIPVIAAPMDTVANADLSIALALEGGISCIHYNHKKHDNTPDIEAQVDEVIKVKRFQQGFISDPLTASPDITIGEAKQRGARYGVDLHRSVMGSGIIDTFPVTEDGTLDTKLIGLLTKECYWDDTWDELVGNRMYNLDELEAKGFVVKGEIDDAAARKHLDTRKLRHLIVVDNQYMIRYLVTKKDIQNRIKYPDATRDEQGRLRVLFAAPTKDYEGRIDRCFEAGADGCIVDTSQGNTIFAKQAIGYIREKYPDKLIIGGNISTAASVQSLSTFGMDSFRCGQGSGSICTTQKILGTGRTGASGIYDCALASRLLEYKLRVIADGGISCSGDAIKALTLGADAVMLGNLLAGTSESPGEIKINERGEKVVEYWGMGSHKALGPNMRDYGIEAQGVSGYVPYKGSVHDVMKTFINSIKKGLQVYNCRTISELHERTFGGSLYFELRRPGGIVEGNPHNLKP